ncbi:MAG: RdgB/HAM1 family non-canonical purine NTP pyrophosphatase [bacterium]|nr:RdgB/HAM1 family non-canonical purine NTP pyrophosphatase [bacterium]MDZ4232115.1 RdgB/HAM1 family non-canonical purine NTP pyrophosphatase [Candidatus Pacearchaeota archaeon]
MRLSFATSNEMKVKEAQEILGFPIEICPLEIPEIQSLDIEEVARDKVQKAYEIVGIPVFADDGGLFFEAWSGFPGPLVKYLLESVGIEGILRMLEGFEDRRALAKGVIAYCDASGVRIFTGEVRGLIPPSPRGERWGWDPIFVPEGQSKTYAEMSFEEKNRISHRRKSLEKFRTFLAS